MVPNAPASRISTDRHSRISTDRHRSRPDDTAHSASPAPRPSGTGWSVQRDADALRDAGVTGAAVRPETPRGTVTARSGVEDLFTRRPVPQDGHLRLGSTTTDGRRTVTVSAHSRSADPRTAARQEDALRRLIDHALCTT